MTTSPFLKAYLLKVTKKWNFPISSSSFHSWASKSSAQELYQGFYMHNNLEKTPSSQKKVINKWICLKLLCASASHFNKLQYLSWELWKPVLNVTLNTLQGSYK